MSRGGGDYGGRPWRRRRRLWRREELGSGSSAMNGEGNSKLDSSLDMDDGLRSDKGNGAAMTSGVWRRGSRRTAGACGSRTR